LDVARERQLLVAAGDEQLLVASADGEHRAGELADHVRQRPPEPARADERGVQRQVQDDLVGVAVTRGGRPRPAAVAQERERIPCDDEHAQVRRDPLLSLRERRPREPQLEQHPLGLGRGAQRVAHLICESGTRIEHRRGG
jgi:hypothetical protein